MRVVIPVAGLGKRFLPITNSIQKCLMPIAGKPILYHILKSLKNINFTEVSLIVGHLSSQVESFCNKYSKKFNINFKLYNQDSQEGLAHAIQLGLDKNDDRAVLILLGDTIFPINFQQIIDEKESVIGAFKVSNPERWGIIEYEGSDIKRLIEKPKDTKSNLAIAGVYYINSQKKLYNAIQYLINNDIKTNNEFQLTDALQYMLLKGHVFKKFKIPDYYDCGTPENYINANKQLINSTNRNMIHAKAQVCHDSDLNYCSIDKKCFIENSKLNNVIMLSGSSVKNSILSNVIIGKNILINNYNKKNSENIL